MPNLRREHEEPLICPREIWEGYPLVGAPEAYFRGPCRCGTREVCLMCGERHVLVRRCPPCASREVLEARSGQTSLFNTEARHG